jgi:tripartite-type tricarboxylate transporter receptor subunit TctC
VDARLRRALALLLALGASSALAQSWPQRPVHVIVPFVAGGNTDSQARIVTERLNELLGQPLVVENKVGAGGAIAAEFVAKSAPDGYTLFFAASPQFSLPLLQKVNFDPYKDFAPISIVGTNPFVLGVHGSVPATTLKEFVDYVKPRPGQLNYASAGAGTITHLTTALFLSLAGLQMTHVPYKGGAQASADLVAGQVQMYFGNPSELMPHVASGKIRLLAVSGAKRTPQLPDVPTIAESYPGFATGTWNGFLAPTGTPPAIIERLAHQVAKAVREPATAERLRKIGVEPLGNTPAEFAALVQREAPIWRDAVQAAGIRAE